MIEHIAIVVLMLAVVLLAVSNRRLRRAQALAAWQSLAGLVKPEIFAPYAQHLLSDEWANALKNPHAEVIYRNREGKVVIIDDDTPVITINEGTHGLGV